MPVDTKTKPIFKKPKPSNLFLNLDLHTYIIANFIKKASMAK